MIDLTPKATLHRITQFTPALLLLHAGTAAGEEHGSDRHYGLYELLPTLAWPCAALGVATLFFLAYRMSRQKELALAETSPDSIDQLFTQEHITQTFISAIPTLTQELNLEVATAEQVETFERMNEKRVLWGWMNLGTNVARIRVPVTYRFHIRLYETWRLEVNGSALVVHAPAIRPSLPPAFHSHRMERQTSRGWARLSPEGLLQDLHRDLTPALCHYAGDERRLELVRETCRQSVAEFIQKWLEGESRWKPGAFTSTLIQFEGEHALPAKPTRQLMET